MTSRRAAVVLVALLWAGLAFRVITVWDRLPARMASHFAASGRPDGWMSRSGFWTFTALVEGGVILVLLLIPIALRRVPDSLINLPNRDHWLAEGRRDQAITRLAVWMSWFAVAMSGLLVAVNELVIRANLARAPLAERWFWVALVSFLGFVAAWVVGLYRAFRLPPRPPS
jgi:uncharacterized membrane protein